jgi:hypothetical protein
MMTEVWRKTKVVGLGLFFILSVTGCNAQKQQVSSTQKEDALRSLRDSGVITPQEYDQRLSQLHGGGHAVSPQTSAAPNHMWHMKKAEVMTMTGWDAMPQWNIPARPQHQVVALTMLVPVDWQFQGAHKEFKIGDCNFTEGRIAFFTVSPDKTAGMISWPHPVSIWSNDPSILQQIQQDNRQFASMQNCKTEQPQPLSQQMDSLVRGFAPELGGKLHATGPMEPVPGIADKLRVAVDSANQNLAARGSHIDIDVGRIPIRNNDSSDTGEGYLTVMQEVRSDRLSNGATVWTIDYPLQVATFAPQGKYASMAAMFTAMLDSVHLDPSFQQDAMQASANIQSIKQQTKQRLNQIAAQMQLDNLNAARQQAAIRQDAQNYSNRVISNVAANRSAALEHSSQQFSMYMGDQALYHDPTTGGTVQLPSGSNHAWASQTGNTNEYILTDSSSFNPNGNVGSGSWTQMQAVR